MKISEWAIEDVITAYPGLSFGEFAAMAVAVMKEMARPCDFLVEVQSFDFADLDGESQFILRVTWNPDTDGTAERVVRTRQQTPIVEGAAIALAALLLAHMIKGSDLEVMKRQHRADYLLTHLQCALELSGTERARELPARQREKRRQLLQNILGLDGYVVVCCFEEGHRVIRWSYHLQPE